MGSKNLQKYFQMTVLLVGSLASIATSSSSGPTLRGEFIVTSDCGSSFREQESVTLVQGQISEPADTSFNDYGFPQNEVNRGPVVGTFNGVQRDCYLTYEEAGFAPDMIFSCFDDGLFTCTIILSEKN